MPDDIREQIAALEEIGDLGTGYAAGYNDAIREVKLLFPVVPATPPGTRALSDERLDRVRYLLGRLKLGEDWTNSIAHLAPDLVAEIDRLRAVPATTDSSAAIEKARGDVHHNIQPIIGVLRLRQRDAKAVAPNELHTMLVRLYSALDAMDVLAGGPVWIRPADVAAAGSPATTEGG